MPKKLNTPGSDKSLADRVLDLVAELGPGECYDLRETAAEWGVSGEGLRMAAKKAGALSRRFIGYHGGGKGKLFLVNPQHAEEADTGGG